MTKIVSKRPLGLVRVASELFSSLGPNHHGRMRYLEGLRARLDCSQKILHFNRSSQAEVRITASLISRTFPRAIMSPRSREVALILNLRMTATVTLIDPPPKLFPVENTRPEIIL